MHREAVNKSRNPDPPFAELVTSGEVEISRSREGLAVHVAFHALAQDGRGEARIMFFSGRLVPRTPIGSRSSGLCPHAFDGRLPGRSG